MGISLGSMCRHGGGRQQKPYSGGQCGGDFFEHVVGLGFGKFIAVPYLEPGHARLQKLSYFADYDKQIPACLLKKSKINAEC